MNLGLEVPSFWVDVSSLVVAGLSLLVGTIVAIVVYKLSRQLDFRTRMHTWEELRLAARGLLPQGDGVTEVRVLNTHRYRTDYQGGNSWSRRGWEQEKAEMFDVRHDGVELIDGIVQTWFDGDGRRTWRKTLTPAPNVYRVGLVHFDSLEYINPDGDEFGGEPQLFVRFGGRRKSPYSRYRYFEMEGRPLGPSGRLYRSPVDELGAFRHPKETLLRRLRTRQMMALADRRARRYSGR